MASILRTSRKVFIFSFSLVVGGIGAGLWLNMHPGDIPTQSTVTLGVPVGYLSYSDLLAATDATLQVTVTSSPLQYLDFGKDGLPDYVGQPGLPVELVSAVVDKVLRGDPALKGKSIILRQPPSSRSSQDETAADRMGRGGHFVVVASEVVPNPGVGTSARVWIPVGAGQGIFDVNPDGSLSIRRPGVWPEIFGKDGSLRVASLPNS